MNPQTLKLQLAKRKGNKGDFGLVKHPKSVPSGIYTFDSLTGTGGFPLGKASELYGKWQTAKSTLCYHTVAEVIKAGGVALILDYERAVDYDYLETILGIDPEHPNLIVYAPESIEDGGRFAIETIKSGICRFVMFDSVATAIAEDELNKDFGDKTLIGIRARSMADFLRRVVPLLKPFSTHLAFINHEQKVIETGYAARFAQNKTTTPGGEALKFWAHLRVQFRVVGSKKIKRRQPDGTDYEAPFASIIEAMSLKNKQAPPFQRAKFYIFFGRGIVNEASLLDIATNIGIVQQSGAIFKFQEYYFKEDAINKRGLMDALDYIQDNEQVNKILTKEVLTRFPQLIPLSIKEKLAKSKQAKEQDNGKRSTDDGGDNTVEEHGSGNVSGRPSGDDDMEP